MPWKSGNDPGDASAGRQGGLQRQRYRSSRGAGHDRRRCRRAADVDVDALGAPTRKSVQGGADAVAQDEGAGDEGDAEHDGERGEQEAGRGGLRTLARVNRSMSGRPPLARSPSCVPGRRLRSGRRARRRSGRRRGTAPGRRKLPRTGSCVTMTMVWPKSSTERRRNPRISAPARESRFPVGSSAKMIAGLLTRARAQATRCCWPPDSSLGRWESRSRIPRVSTTVSNHGGSSVAPAMSTGG